MQHRISVGVLVERDGCVLLVRHAKQGVYDFWVAPGGGVQGHESLEDAAVREAREETGLHVAVGRLAYVEELVNPDWRHVKFWFDARWLGGEIDATAPEAVAEFIVEAAWLPRARLTDVTVFPSVLTGRYWADREAGFPEPVRMPLREMEFW